MAEQRKKISCGIELPTAAVLAESLNCSTNLGYHFIVVPIIHPRLHRELIRSRNRSSFPLTRCDLLLPSTSWNRLIVGRLSPYIDIDSEAEDIRRHSELLLSQELDVANAFGFPAITMKITSGRNTNLGLHLLRRMSGSFPCQVWIQIPMVQPNMNTHRENAPEPEDTWEWWNQLRSVCNFDKKLSVALELGDLPTSDAVERWLGEPVKCLVIPTSLFLTNQHSHPVLSRAHQELVQKFITIDVQYFITGKCLHNSLSQYYEYMDYLGKKLFKPTDFTDFVQGCEDYLQNPLQPLSENLETFVYEVFEKDPFKYNQYQLAIQKALIDFNVEGDKNIVVMVVGAGRGPLIKATLNAARITGKNVKVYALEKNPHALNTLSALAKELWPGLVTIVPGDMRHYMPEEKADILVSELLGSFADNELSPECLDGAQRFLNEGGISIPSSYSSWVSPLQSIKIMNDIRNNRPAEKSVQSTFEMPYVVHLVNQYRIAPSKKLFTFKHPNKSEVIDNRRFTSLKFQSKQNCVLTGFAGYFDCDLYKGVMMSTEPSTYSQGMMSWFPIVFPIEYPVPIKAGDTIEVAFTRCVTETKVWYEWVLLQPVTGAVHNPNGRSYTISL